MHILILVLLFFQIQLLPVPSRGAVWCEWMLKVGPLKMRVVLEREKPTQMVEPSAAGSSMTLTKSAQASRPLEPDSLMADLAAKDPLAPRQRSDYNRGCFAGATAIDTPRGPRLIQDIRPGDEVFSFDVESGVVVVNQVESVFTYEDVTVVDLVFADGSRIGVNPLHQFWDHEMQKWKSIGDFRSGMALPRVLAGHQDSLGVSLEIDELANFRRSRVFNLKMRQAPFNFLVRGVVVKNGPRPKPIL